METILSNGLFWGSALAIFAGIAAYLTNRYVEKMYPDA